MIQTMYRMLLFDRDGTLTFENFTFHRDLSILPAYPFTPGTLQRLHKAGLSMAVVTNQSGIARGFWSIAEVEKLHQRFTNEWQVPIKFYICPHHPEDMCACRKPGVGLLEKAMAEHAVDGSQCLMIGDSVTDFKSARAAHLDFALVLTGRGPVTRERLSGSPTMILDTLAELSTHIAS